MRGVIPPTFSSYSAKTFGGGAGSAAGSGSSRRSAAPSRRSAARRVKGGASRDSSPPRPSPLSTAKVRQRPRKGHVGGEFAPRHEGRRAAAKGLYVEEVQRDQQLLRRLDDRQQAREEQAGDRRRAG